MGLDSIVLADGSREGLTAEAEGNISNCSASCCCGQGWAVSGVSARFHGMIRICRSTYHTCHGNF